MKQFTALCVCILSLKFTASTTLSQRHRIGYNDRRPLIRRERSPLTDDFRVVGRDARNSRPEYNLRAQQLYQTIPSRYRAKEHSNSYDRPRYSNAQPVIEPHYQRSWTNGGVTLSDLQARNERPSIYFTTQPISDQYQTPLDENLYESTIDDEIRYHRPLVRFAHQSDRQYHSPLYEKLLIDRKTKHNRPSNYYTSRRQHETPLAESYIVRESEIRNQIPSVHFTHQPRSVVEPHQTPVSKRYMTIDHDARNEIPLVYYIPQPVEESEFREPLAENYIIINSEALNESPSGLYTHPVIKQPFINNFEVTDRDYEPFTSYNRHGEEIEMGDYLTVINRDTVNDRPDYSHQSGFEEQFYMPVSQTFTVEHHGTIRPPSNHITEPHYEDPSSRRFTVIELESVDQLPSYADILDARSFSPGVFFNDGIDYERDEVVVY